MSLRMTVPLLILLLGLRFCAADDPVFSGPQPGEALVPFQVVTVYGDNAGQQVDPIELAAGKPTLLVFVHKLTRPGMALTRGLTSYAKNQAGAASGIVWLDDDKAKAEEYLTRAKKSLNFTAPVGVTIDGGEGPGAYGLNRNVELTILIADKNRVIANFALVQPSVTEGPEIAGKLAKLLAQPAPTAQEFEKLAYPGGGMRARRNMQKKPAEPAPSSDDLRTMIKGLIAADASETELRAAVKRIDDWVGDNKARQEQLGKMAGQCCKEEWGPRRRRRRSRHGTKNTAARKSESREDFDASDKLCLDDDRKYGAGVHRNECPGDRL